MQISAQFTYDKIRFDQEQDAHLVVNLTAPQVSLAAKRRPICVVPVLDCSGSMASSNKFHYAKQSLLKLVEHLTSDDYMGLVSFSDNSTVEADVQKMTPERKEELRRIIGECRITGGTNLSSGLAEAMKQAKRLDIHESTVVRVILFTDGQPTHGLTDEEGLCRMVGKQRGRCSISAFGYGADAAQDLLSKMAGVGEGNYSFVRDPDSALTAFAQELGGLLSAYGQDLVVGIQPQGGHRITEVLSDVQVEEDDLDNMVKVKLSQILSEETISIVLATKMATQRAPGPRAVNAFDIQIAYRTINEDGELEDKTAEAKAKIQFVREADAQEKPTKEVDAAVVRARLIKAQIDAEAAVSRGDYAAARVAMNGAQLAAQAGGHNELSAVINTVSELYNDPNTYHSSSGRRRSLQHVVTRGMGTSLSVEDQQLVASAGYVLSNSTQDLMTQSFTGTSAGVSVESTPEEEPLDVSWLAGAPASDKFSLVAPEEPSDKKAKPAKKANKKTLTKERSKRW